MAVQQYSSTILTGPLCGRRSPSPQTAAPSPHPAGRHSTHSAHSTVSMLPGHAALMALHAAAMRRAPQEMCCTAAICHNASSAVRGSAHRAAHLHRHADGSPDGSRRLGQHRQVGGPAAAPHRASAAVEEGEVDAVLVRNLGKVLLDLVQPPGSRQPPRILATVRVPNHALLQAGKVEGGAAATARWGNSKQMWMPQLPST